MSDMNLTQTEADALIAMEKHRVSDESCLFPMRGETLAINLQSPDKREQFILDISRGRIDLKRGKYQTRARQVIVLVRLDFGGSPHRNPDDTEVACPHLHIYREGFGCKWAYPVPSTEFPNMGKLWETLEDFMKYCNITKPPMIQKGLFS